MGKNVVILGAQWGDEGKGKIIDWLCERVSAVVRFQGGHNAGHTVIVGNDEMIFRLIPSGILHPQVACMLGNGIVLSIEAFLKELNELKEKNIPIKDHLFISPQATLLLPYHAALDSARESSSKNPIGTTKRGIGPAYEDKVARRSLRVIDLADETRLKERLKILAEYHNFQFEHYYHAQTIPYENVLNSLLEAKESILPLVTNIPALLKTYQQEGKHILFEGAQGTLLDLDFGTYPYVTSSNTIASSAATGTGFGLRQFDEILGITKAYMTRVGEGPFVTELHDETGNHLAKRGKEFGSVTGRSRRCGWLDLVLLKYSIQINNLSGLILTKPDVLDELDEIKVCTAYQYGDQKLDILPDDPTVLAACKPIYETLPGWKSKTLGIKSADNFPKNFKKYVNFVENNAKIPVVIVSTGPERNEVVELKNLFNDHKMN